MGAPLVLCKHKYILSSFGKDTIGGFVESKSGDGEKRVKPEGEAYEEGTGGNILGLSEAKRNDKKYG